MQIDENLSKAKRETNEQTTWKNPLNEITRTPKGWGKISECSQRRGDN